MGLPALPLPRLPLLLRLPLVLLVFLLSPAPSWADPDGPSDPAAWTTPFVGPDGEVRLLLRPEFRDAPGLLDDLERFGVEDLLVQLAGPLVPAPDPKSPPVPSRLLLAGPAEAVVRARAVLALLDVPRPTVLVSLLAVEIEAVRNAEVGGRLAFDRDASSSAPNTLFRGLFSAFEPDSYLRSSLTRGRPFAGTSIAFGNSGQDVLEDGLFEVVFRLLAEQGCVEVLSWPTVACSEGIPGGVSSQVEVPQTLITDSAPTWWQVESRAEQTGVQFLVLPLHVGSDAVHLALDATFRFAVPDTASADSAGSIALRERHVQTELTIRDQETVLVGGLRIRRKVGSERGLPLLVGMPGLSARGDEYAETDLVLLLRARILVPGAGSGAGVLPPAAVRRVEAEGRVDAGS